MWNHFQHWTCELCLVKTTCYFVWEHVDYVTGTLATIAIIYITNDFFVFKF